ncbi:MAG: phosphatidylinositol mannoside acyltransferase [Acidimicrobiales bacterium]
MARTGPPESRRPHPGRWPLAPSGPHPALSEPAAARASRRTTGSELRRLAPYHAYRAGSALAQALPGPVASGAAQVAAVVAGRLGRRRRAMITRHLERIHGPSLRSRALELEVDRAFASYGRYWMESFRLPSRAPYEFEAAMCYEGIGNLEAARAEGRGVLMAMPHLGAWDWGGAWLTSSGFPLTVVAESLEPPELSDWFAELRHRMGMTVIPLDRHAGAAVIAALRRGEVLGLLSDRDLTGDGVEVEFFGEPTRLPAGPATLALRTGAPLLVCCVLFEGDHHRGIVLPPLDTSRHGSLREDVTRITQDVAHRLEGLIRRAPEQWHVFQPNWPSDPGYGR